MERYGVSADQATDRMWITWQAATDAAIERHQPLEVAAFAWADKMLRLHNAWAVADPKWKGPDTDEVTDLLDACAALRELKGEK